MTRRTAMTTLLSPLLSSVTWRDLPPLPRALGGQFAGISADHLLVAGGSYFNTPPWSGGSKQRVDTIYALSRGSGWHVNDRASGWRLTGRLPTPTASGASATTPSGLLCTGGQSPTANLSDCLLLHTDRAPEPYPPLPQPLSMHAAVCDGESIYIAGGQAALTATTALPLFLRLRLDNLKRGWERLPDLPETGRILPVLTASHEGVFLISGASLTGTPGPPPGRRFLADAWRFDGKTWHKLAPPPSAVQAAPAIIWNRRILVFGGNDGSLADREFELQDHYPGFRRDILSYDIAADRWQTIGQLPVGLVTTSAAIWHDEVVIPGGEVRPAFRSARVLAGRIELK